MTTKLEEATKKQLKGELKKRKHKIPLRHHILSDSSILPISSTPVAI